MKKTMLYAFLAIFAIGFSSALAVAYQSLGDPPGYSCGDDDDHDCPGLKPSS